MLLGSLGLGVVAGLLPGLHPNSVGVILAKTLGNNPALPMVLVVLLGLHTVLEFLPSIFLGVPESDTEVGVLPGRRLFFQGRATEAVLVCAVSAVLATAGAIMLSPLTVWLLPDIFAIVKPWTAMLLVLAVAALLLTEAREGRLKQYDGGVEEKTEPDNEGKKRDSSRGWRARRIVLAGLVFCLAAALGVMALRAPMSDPLLALFVGFFTMPALLGAAEEAGEDICEQRAVHTLTLDFGPYVLIGLVLGGLADLLPGISTPAQIAVFASLFVPVDDARHFIALVASIAASHAAFALTAAASVGVTRVGAVALANAAVPIQPADLPMLLGAFALAVGLGALLMMRVGNALSSYWSRLDLRLLGRLLAIYLVCVVALTDGALGLAVLATATAIGMLPILWGVRRTHVMGAIIGPSLLHTFGM